MSDQPPSETPPDKKPPGWRRVAGIGGSAIVFVGTLFPQVWQIPLSMLRDGAIKVGGDYVRDYIHHKTKPLETGSIDRKNDAQKRAEAECKAQKAKDLPPMIARRQAAWDDYTTCLTDTKPAWGSTQTVKQVCAPKLDTYQRIKQEVLDREAKDCPSTASR